MLLFRSLFWGQVSKAAFIALANESLTTTTLPPTMSARAPATVVCSRADDAMMATDALDGTINGTAPCESENRAQGDCHGVRYRRSYFVFRNPDVGAAA